MPRLSATGIAVLRGGEDARYVHFPAFLAMLYFFSGEAFHGDLFALPVTQKFLAALFMLGIAWRLVASRWQAFVLLVAWHAGAGAFIPDLYLAFFGEGWWIGLAWYIFWAMAVSAPVLVLPDQIAIWRLPVAVLIAQFLPFGAMTPLIAAMAPFPGWGWAGIAFAFIVLFVVGLGKIVRVRTHIAILAVIALTGSVLNTLYVDPKLPPGVWGVTTYEGVHPGETAEWLARQQRVAGRVIQDVKDGATFVVTPENTLNRSGVLWEVHWLHAMTATAGKAQVLIGWQENSENYLFDIMTGAKYHGTMPMVVGMWHPWKQEGHYPIRFDALFDVIESKDYGRLPYLICYEEVLVVPLTAKMYSAGSPRFIISAANQWFGNKAPGAMTTQERSLAIQARLWGVPVVRAANYSSL